MIKLPLHTAAGGKKEGQVTLAASIFEVTPNDEILALAYRSYLAAGRSAKARTKTRGEVSGGGRKPWRQKGTGRARVGSIRVPHFTGGGVVFGPTGHENYQINLPAKVKRAAICQALSAQAKAGRLVVIETFACPEGKVKPTLNLLTKLDATGNVLIVVSKKDELVDRATRNIPGVKSVQAGYLNVFDVLNADKIILSRKSIELINEWLGEAKPAAKAKVEART